MATTTGIAVAVFALSRSLSGAGFGGAGIGGLMVLLVVGGVLVNTVAGLTANARGESWGCRNAAICVAILIATIVLSLGLR